MYDKFGYVDLVEAYSSGAMTNVGVVAGMGCSVRAVAQCGPREIESHGEAASVVKTLRPKSYT